MAAGRAILSILRFVLWEDKLLKLVCLVLAVLAWFYIDGELTEEREFTVHPRAEQFALPKGLLFAQETWPDFQVRVRGPRRRLQYLSEENIQFHFDDLANAAPGTNTVAVRPNDVREIEGVLVTRVTPGTFEVQLQRLSQKVVTVKPYAKGRPKQGFYLGDALRDPEVVTIESLQDLELVDSVWTEPIDVTERSESFEKTVGIQPFVEVDGQRIEIRCDAQVRVTLQIRRLENERVFENVPVRALAPPGAAMFVDPPTVTVRATYSPDEFPDFGMANLRLYVEWPPEWDLKRKPGEPWAWISQQVKVDVNPRVQVRGEDGMALPSVRVRGVIAEVPSGTP